MPTDPLTGSRYPASSAAPNVAQDIQNAVFDLSENTIPYFASTTARDTAYSSWLANGGTARPGLYSQVGEVLYKTTGTGMTWNVVPTAYEIRAMRAQRTSAAPFPNETFTPFNSNTGWTETDPWGMRATGANFSAPFTGWYQLNVTVEFAANATGKRAIRLVPSVGQDIGAGSGSGVRLGFVNATAGGSATVISGSHITSLTSGATVAVEAYQNSGADLNVDNIFISSAYLGPNT